MQHINIFTKTRWLVTIIFLTTLCIGQMWGADPSWTHTFSSTSAPTVTNNQVTVNSVTWDLSTTVGKGSPSRTSGNDNSVRAWKFGSSANHYYSNITLSTTYFSSYNVKSVEIIGCSNNANKEVSITVSQGSGNSAITIGNATIQKAYSSDWHTNSDCKKTMNTNQGSGGTLTISISPDACAFSLRQIKVTYTTASCTAPTAVAPQNGSFGGTSCF